MNIEHRYSIRNVKNFLLTKGTSQEVKDYINNFGSNGLSVEIWRRNKPCCPDEDTYLGSFPASEVLVKISS